MEPQNSIYVPIIIGLVEVVKKMGMPSKFSPILAMLFGIGFSLSSGVVMFETIITGVVWGLASSGLYSGTKSVTK